MLLVVGGHSRNIGKTSAAAGIIAALPEARWTAVKITQHGHGVCSAAGEPCQCALDLAHPYALSEQHEPDSTDTGRFLAAGAVRSWWLRTAAGQLAYGLPSLRRIVDESENVLLESNSVLGFLRPELYLVVIDPAVADWKTSARRQVDRADAYLVVERPAPLPALPRKPAFLVRPPAYLSAGVVRFVAGRLALAKVAPPAGAAPGTL